MFHLGNHYLRKRNSLHLHKLLISLRMACSEYRGIHFYFQLQDNILTMFLGWLIHYIVVQKWICCLWLNIWCVVILKFSVLCLKPMTFPLLHVNKSICKVENIIPWRYYFFWVKGNLRTKRLSLVRITVISHLPN